MTRKIKNTCVDMAGHRTFLMHTYWLLASGPENKWIIRVVASLCLSNTCVVGLMIILSIQLTDTICKWDRISGNTLTARLVFVIVVLIQWHVSTPRSMNCPRFVLQTTVLFLKGIRSKERWEAQRRPTNRRDWKEIWEKEGERLKYIRNNFTLNASGHFTQI